MFLGTSACFHALILQALEKIPKTKDRARGKSRVFSKCTSLVWLNQWEAGDTGRETDDEDKIGNRSEADENNKHQQVDMEMSKES